MRSKRVLLKQYLHHFLTTIRQSPIVFARTHYLFPSSVSFHHLSIRVRALVSAEAETSSCRPFACRRALLAQHHHHHHREINEEVGTSTACLRLACSSQQQHAEAAIATALAQAEEAAYRIAGGLGLDHDLARMRYRSEVGVEASAGGRYPLLDRGNHVRCRHHGGEEG